MSLRRRRAHVWLVTSIATTSCDWFRSAGPGGDDLLWVSPHQNHSWPEPAVDSTRVFVVDGTGALRAVARGDGREAWRIELAQRPLLAPTEASRRSAALLQQVFDVDPLADPTCHRAVRMVAFIT